MDELQETKVRATLAGRPAGILDSFERVDGQYHAEGTFAALFNGAMQGLISKRGVFFGKAEAEWGWPHAWEQLRDAGLISFVVDEAAGRVHWHITDKGWEVRKDDLAYFRELMDAKDADEDATLKAPNPAQ